MKRFSYLVLFFYVSIPSISCNDNNRASEAKKEIENSLKIAGNNKDELIIVIDHYKNDSLKLRAAVFLIENMASKGYYKFDVVNSIGNKVDFDVFKYNFSKTLMEKEKFENQIGSKVWYINKGYQQDLQNVTSEILIENIDFAFVAWNMPWAKHLTFNEFRELLLPYRIDNEPLQKWRKACYENSQWAIDSLKGSIDVLQLCTVINDSLKRKYEYRHKEMSFFSGRLNLSQVNSFGGGRCEDLNMVAAYWMRALGVPVALEFTPYWANSNYGGHSWLSIYYHGKFIPFNSAYDNPILDSLPFKGAHLAKCYRKTFSYQEHGLIHPINANDSTGIPAIFKNRGVIDITKEHMQVSDVSIAFDIINPEPKFVFLGVLNGKYWKPIQWGEIHNGVGYFKDMARNVLYAPLCNINGEFKIAGHPFFLGSNGQIQILIPDVENKIKISLDVKRINWLRSNSSCHIIYWNGMDWASAGKAQMFDSTSELIEFNEIPSSALYRIINDSSTNRTESSYGRPFLMNKEVKKIVDY
jgi:hypothetical protein